MGGVGPFLARERAGQAEQAGQPATEADRLLVLAGRERARVNRAVAAVLGARARVERERRRGEALRLLVEAYLPAIERLRAASTPAGLALLQAHLETQLAQDWSRDDRDGGRHYGVLVTQYEAASDALAEDALGATVERITRMEEHG